MGVEQRYSKRMKLHREIANILGSYPKSMNGGSRERFLHESINLALNQSPLLTEIRNCLNGNRVNGSVDVDLPILIEDWYTIQDMLKLLRQLRRFDEGDLIQFCLAFKIDDLKKKGIV